MAEIKILVCSKGPKEGDGPPNLLEMNVPLSQALA